MIDVIKKTMLLGVGLAAMTKDKVEEYARDLADNAKLSSEKGKQFVDEVVQRAEKAREDLESTVRCAVNDQIKKSDLLTRDDIAKLTERIEQLEQKLASKSE